MLPTQPHKVNELYRLVQLEFAEDAAYINDRENVLSALLIASRLNVRNAIGQALKPSPNEEVNTLRQEIAETLYRHAIQAPRDLQFTSAWLYKAHCQLFPDNDIDRNRLRDGIEFLVKAKAVSPVPPTEPSGKRTFAVANPHLLLGIIEGRGRQPANRHHALKPATLRGELQRYAEMMADQGRTYEAVLMMATARIMRDPETPSPPPTYFLPDIPRLSEDAAEATVAHPPEARDVPAPTPMHQQWLDSGP